jgi:hypothetical protein
MASTTFTREALPAFDTLVSRYAYEYVSATVQMFPIEPGAVWELDIAMANRGTRTEAFRVYFIEAYSSLDPSVTDEPLAGTEITVEPGTVGRIGLGAEVEPGLVDYEVWWARIFTTSRNLVPTMQFHVEDDPNAPPEFFFGPGDFAVFKLAPPIEPPAVGPAREA